MVWSEPLKRDVVLQVTVDQNGMIHDVRAISGPPLSIPAAIDAVRKWRDAQTTLTGHPVGALDEITVAFRLGNGASFT